jgi:Protein of unknown function (DUF1553)/Protein of unknown function (DUF1549)/Planctomycete cytochrome C/Concanavalin A-like lectin/glucanases superfamily
MIPRWLFLTPLALALSVHAANDAQNDSQPGAAEAANFKPLVKWTFDEPVVGKWSGKPKIEAQGPQQPMFPNMPKGNKAAFFSGKDSALTVKESDLPDVDLRFKKGDAITLEAWVNVDDLKDGKYVYLIGKGRNKNKEFAAENQNYALRLKGDGGEARLCFLFRTESEKLDGDKDYHRWASDEGFAPGSGWHHVAVSFIFGKADSINGHVDGKPVKGKWDMGGKSDKAPVNDADDLVIGTGNGGGAGNTLVGWLDEVAIYRAVLPESVLAQRYQFVPPAPVVDAKTLPKGKVRIDICEEGIPEKNAWPAFPPKASESYEEDVFGIFDVPHKYVDTGVRGDRPNPYLLRAAANVKLPAGKHRLLLRARSAARVYVDGKQILTLPFMTGDSGGHGEVKEQAKFLDLGPDCRFAPPGTQEIAGEFVSKGKEHLIVIEQMIGGPLGKSKHRPETGEMVLAISKQGSESWELLSPGTRKVPYTDAAWAAYHDERAARLAEMDTERRAAVRASTDGYWTKRREAAQQWLASTAEVKVPAVSVDLPSNNEIDRFIGAKIETVSAQFSESQKGTVDFFKDIQPILETKCLDCHKGAKVKGGLRLDTLADAIKGGKDEGAAITPHKPEKSSLLKRVASKDEDEVMPPKGTPLDAGQIATLTKWISEGAHWPEMRPENTTPTALTDDLAFLRRVTLDTVGVVPSLEEIDAFSNDSSTDKRAKVIDRLLDDPRWADHWMGYWLDVLAENPNMLNPTLNNTGPFRWWIYESLLDDKPLDLFVTELVRMRGSERYGGPAGFAVASQNDVPMAAKGTIVSTAFLGVEMKCARCHDSPAGKSTQQDLFELASMLKTEALAVPITSSVASDRLTMNGRKPLITVTLKPGTKVEPKWPFDEFCSEAVGEKLAEDAKDQRDRLAALITAPQNERFAQVMANRIWARFMGRGIVEPVADWEKGKPTHPELLKWLARELVRSGYSTKHLARLILNSHAYQRATDASLRGPSPLYVSPAPRRLGAEQIVDSMFAATGKPFRTEEVSLDIDGRRDMGNSISLGQPRRCWMLTSTSNERDRPSLNLPRISAVADVLAAFGWRGARQDPTSIRETAPNALQPAIMSNGTVSVWLTRLSDDHGITQLALKDQTVDQLVDTLFMKLLTRKPTADEKARYSEHLKAGFETRIRNPKSALRNEPMPSSSERQPVKYVSWSNHLDPEATIVRQQQEFDARRGDAPTEKLDAEWRTRLEDVLWALLNAPEWVFAP